MFLRVAGLSLLAGSLVIGATVQAATVTKNQGKLYRHESGFLGSMYSELHPDPGNGNWLIYFLSDTRNRRDGAGGHGYEEPRQGLPARVGVSGVYVPGAASRSGERGLADLL